MSFAIALALSLALMPVAHRLGLRIGLVDRPTPDGLKIHASPVPVLGGPAMVLAVLVGIAVAGEAGGWVGVCLATVIGLADDARSLGPLPRVAAVASAGLITATASLAGVEPAVAAPLGVALGLACANAVNLVDGQDGLAGGLGGLAVLSMAASGQILDINAAVPIGVAIAGGLVGFLVWNRPPARVFLGNGGAYGLGLLLALQAGFLVTSGPRGFLSAALALGVFAFEVLLTIVRRIGSRAPLALGDRRHSYDLLSARWGSRPRATLALHCVGAVSGLAGIVVAAFPGPLVWSVVAAAVLMASIAGRAALRASSRSTGPSSPSGPAATPQRSPIDPGGDR
jgi:UDP-GlcNAc:undecaprenyl-phosphate GlcNAc-1-phosphate transferase